MLLLSACLLGWQPLTFTLRFTRALTAFETRGWPLAVITAADLVATALGLAAGLALGQRRGIGVTMAKTALLLGAVVDLAVYLTPYVPNNRMPGDDPLYMAGSFVYYAGWLTYLFRSREIRRL